MSIFLLFVGGVSILPRLRTAIEVIVSLTDVDKQLSIFRIREFVCFLLGHAIGSFEISCVLTGRGGVVA